MADKADDLEWTALQVVHSDRFDQYMGPGYQEAALPLLKNRLVSRLVLSVSAAVLYGFDPVDDPLIAMLLVGYSSGTLTQKAALKLLDHLETMLLMRQNVLQVIKAGDIGGMYFCLERRW